jgi:hypothetical protein
MKNILTNAQEIENDINELRLKGLGSALFPFANFQGLTSSENILIKLCQQSFLSLWTLPNLFKEKGKELADVVIVFDEHIIIISDKEGHSKTTDPKLKWQRFQKHIEKSQRQLLGAQRWIKKYPDKIFLDAQCTKKIFQRLPKEPKFHLISVFRGFKSDSLKYYKQHDGSLPIDTSCNQLFSITSNKVDSSFIHTFDEVGIDKVIREINTISDFISYLEDREKLFTKNSIQSFGETPLLGSFLIGRNKNIHENIFECKAERKNKQLIYKNNIYYKYIKTECYKNWLIDKIKSIFVDYFIEKFINIGDPRNSNPLSSQSIQDTEIAIQEFAKTSRVQRIDFYNCMQDLAQKCHVFPNESPVRTFQNPLYPTQTFILLFLKKNNEESFDEYRLRRHETLSLHCEKAESSNSFGTSKVFIGFATDHLVKDYDSHSEDLVALFQSNNKKTTSLPLVEYSQDYNFRKIFVLLDGSSESKNKLIKEINLFLYDKHIYFPKLDNILSDELDKNTQYPFNLIVVYNHGIISFETI